jgi:hypothetical protein
MTDLERRIAVKTLTGEQIVRCSHRVLSTPCICGVCPLVIATAFKHMCLNVCARPHKPAQRRLAVSAARHCKCCGVLNLYMALLQATRSQ